MPVRLILLLTLLLHSVLYCQVRVSKVYRTPPRSTLLGIYNFEPDHFYVTRYNRLAHDITIERRKKSDGSVSAFTALKLDSVNASWFNYENLEHALFKKQGALYFVFSRVVNNKSELYMKRLDTAGRSSGFFQIMSVDAEKHDDFLDLSFSVTKDLNLLVCRTRAIGANIYRVIDLYDPASRTTINCVKLPPENPLTGYSRDYVFDGNGNLYYLLYRNNYEWNIEDQTGLEFGYAALMSSSVSVQGVDQAYLSTRTSTFVKKPVEMNGLTAVHVASPSFIGRRYRLQVMYSGADSLDRRQMRFLVQDFDSTLAHINAINRALRDDLAQKLTFYDGSQYDDPSRRSYSLESCISAGRVDYHFSERVEDNFYKELLVWECDSAGNIGRQLLIPRKILYFSDRTRFKTLGKVMHASNSGRVYTFLLENLGNEKTSPEEFNFPDFRRQESVNGANLVVYVLKDGDFSKKVVFRNGEYSCVPVNYSGDMSDIVLYMVKNDVERFGMVRLRDL